MAHSPGHSATFNAVARSKLTESCPRAGELTVRLGTATADADVRAVALALAPRFARAEAGALRVSVIDGGLTNALFAVSLGDAPGSTVLVRVFGTSTERVIDRERDGILFELLSQLRIGPSLLGAFGNGRVEQFIDGGRTLEPDDMAHPDIAPLVGAAVGAFHRVLRDDAASQHPELWGTMAGWLAEAEAVEAEGTPLAEAVGSMFGGRGMAAARERLQWAEARLQPGPAAAAARERLRWAEARLQPGPAAAAAGSEPGSADASARAVARAFARETVLCHNDLLGGNLLLVPAESRVQLLDFEYSAPGPRAFDWGNHFGEHGAMECDFGKHYPAGTAAKMPFLRAYMRAAAPDIVAEAEAAGAAGALWEELALEADRFAVAGHLFWGLWAVVQARWSEVEFDFAAYAVLRLEGGLAAHALLLDGEEPAAVSDDAAHASAALG